MCAGNVKPWFTLIDRFDGRFTSTSVQENNDTLEFWLGFFEDNPPLSNMQDYEARILVDFRNIHFSEAIYDAAKWRFYPRDKSEEVARKFQSIMFGNPHFSFSITTLPDDTKQTIRYWINYWKENHDVLMNSEFEPQKVSNYYPVIKVENKQKTIHTVYADYTLSLPLVVDRPIDIINSKESLLLNFVVGDQGIKYNYEIYNHLGKRVAEGEEKSNRKKTLEFAVPEGGFVRILPD